MPHPTSTAPDDRIAAMLSPDEMPDWVREVADQADYVDAFTLQTIVDATAEEWARTMFGDNASPQKRFIWVGLLGLQIAREAGPDLIAGWRLTHRTRSRVVLATESPELEARLHFRTTEGGVTVATTMRYRAGLRGALWERLSAVHRRLTPRLMLAAETGLLYGQQARARD